MPLTRPTDVGFRSRPATYTLIIGVVVGMLAAGLGIPFLFGTPLDSANSTAVNAITGTTLPLSGSASEGGAAGSATTLPGQAAAGGLGSGSDGSGGGGGGLTGSGGLTATTVLGGGGGGGPLTASARGVTATTITIAFLLVDLGSIGRLGFGIPGYDLKSQKAYIQTFLDYVNTHGGVLGRKINPVFVAYDPTNQQTSLAACLTATQDHEIFAAVDGGGGLNDQGQLCFTQQHKTPLISLGSFGTPASLYREAAGYLFTVNAAGARSLANTVYMLATAGLLKGKKIGVVDRDFPGVVQTVNDGLVSVLKSYGHTVTYRADLSMDDGTAASQVPLAVQQMQARGVDAIFLLTDFIIGTQFVQSADKSAYRPQYFVSDFGPETNDAAVQSMPSSYQAVGVTTARTGEWRVGLPEPAVDANCRKIYAAATGTDPARSDNEYAGLGVACGLVDLVVKGATNAGADLTRPKYVAGLQAIGRVAFPHFGGFSYRPGKFDGGDLIRMIRHNASCKCWMPEGTFVEPRY